MKKLIVVFAATLFAAGSYAQAPNKLKGPMGDAVEGIKARVSDCEAKAVSKDGKPLAGAAKGAFVKKCMNGGAGPRPMPPKPGMMPKPMPQKPEMMPKPMPHKPAVMPGTKKPMTPQQAKMGACASKGKGMKGDEYKKFMKACLSGK